MTSESGFRPRWRCSLALILFLPLFPARAQDPSAPMAQSQLAPMAQAQQAVSGRLPFILDSVPANTPVPWDDPGSGLSGTIVPFAPELGGGRFCRPLRYTVEGASQRFAVEGERCRLPGGGWGPGRVADHLYEAPEASPLIRDTQAALKRLLYYDGAVDGVASDALSSAILRFERDEQVAQDPQPSSGLLELADAAINRIPAAGSCTPAQPVPDGWSAACGSAAP
ncbi:RT0821/Lpp0805 family surface protein [Acetobacteraceae bacterium KSS8]|uniref:RT0821/Lpp0805 family surface protein n=1 Tax=Endosaccharibacter trunci TaxID=2812733 RepID=A0ABT1W970_9PROT|nr:RT0821/Lpp0805 family surface protein [Acetobacteraceae bacterium KSS8]